MSKNDKKYLFYFIFIVFVGWLIAQYFESKKLKKINKFGIATCGKIYEITKPAGSSNSNVHYFFYVKKRRYEGGISGEHGCSTMDPGCVNKKFKIKYFPEDPSINRIYLSEPCP